MTRPRRSTLIRSARQASNAAKLSEIFGNKKPGVAPGILNFAAIGTPMNVPVAKPITPRNGATGNEFIC